MMASLSREPCLRLTVSDTSFLMESEGTLSDDTLDGQTPNSSDEADLDKQIQ